MKKIYLIFVISILLQLNIFPQQGWISQNSGTNQDLWAFYFLDQNNGWVAGRNGIVVKTTNGGLNWITVNSGTSAWFHSIYFLDQNIGWIVGPDYTVTNASGRIISTTNGGIEWTLDTTYMPFFDPYFFPV